MSKTFRIESHPKLDLPRAGDWPAISSACCMVDPEVVLLGVVAGKAMANAAVPQTNAPRIAKPMFLYVYKNVTPAMLIVWREPRAKASFVATPDRRRLGTTTPAMNKVITNSVSS